MRKAIVFGTLAAFLVLGCGKKEKKEEKSEKTEKGTKPGEGDKKPEEPQKVDNTAKCKAIFEKALDQAAPHFAKLGIKTPPAEIKKAFMDTNKHKLKKCGELTAEQLACVEKQPIPLSARMACKLKIWLSLSVPYKIRKELTVKPKPFDEKTTKKLLKGFKGTWTYEDKRWKRKTVYKVKKDGKGTVQEFKDGKPKGKPEAVEFSFKDELRIYRKKGTTTQTGIFFRQDKKTAYMSFNMIYNVVKLEDKKKFTLPMSSSTHLLVEGGKCNVLDMSYLAFVPATCAWGKDPKTKAEMLTIKYKLGKFPTAKKYFHVKGHLLHQYLFTYKYVRK